MDSAVTPRSYNRPLVVLSSEAKESHFTLELVLTQEGKHGIGPDRKNIEPAHGLSRYQFSVPV